MKYIIVLGDGMADDPIEKLNGKTPLAYAKTPTMDRLSKYSQLGMVQTIPEGMSPGSDTANLAVIGYNPKKYYTGRSPLEALSIGVPMKDTDIALRCNVVTVTDEEEIYENKRILDHSAGEITNEEASILIDAVRAELENEEFTFYAGTSYRHLTIWNQGQVLPMTPPHDILGKEIGTYLPSNEKLKDMMKKSYHILNNHIINIEREEQGKNKANSIWFWGAGTKPSLDSFEEKFHKKGVMISAVDLLKGIAVGAGMKVVKVDGADGTLHTNYEGKTQAAADALLNENYDFAYIHVEAPDEMGHQGSVENKVLSIEYLDERVIKPLTEQLNKSKEPYRLLVLPDHPTPIALRTHTTGAVPYMLYSSEEKEKKEWNYNEEEAKKSGNYIKEGYTLIEKLFEE